MPSRRVSPGFLLTLCLLAAASAHAADKSKKETGFGATKATGAYLTKEQLRSCLSHKARTDQHDAELQKDKAALAAAQDELGRSGDAMKAKLEALDRSDADAVAAHNEQAQARDQQIDAVQARIKDFNGRIEAAKAERGAFVKDCANRRYFEEEEAEIRKGR